MIDDVSNIAFWKIQKDNEKSMKCWVQYSLSASECKQGGI